MTLIAQLTSQLSTETRAAANAMSMQESAVELHQTSTPLHVNASATQHKTLALHHSLFSTPLHAHVTVRLLLLMQVKLASETKFGTLLHARVSAQLHHKHAMEVLSTIQLTVLASVTPSKHALDLVNSMHPQVSVLANVEPLQIAALRHLTTQSMSVAASAC